MVGRAIVYVSHVCDGLEPRMEIEQNLARDDPGGDAANRFPCGSAAAALPVANAVLRLIGEIGVRRSKGLRRFRIILRTRIFVHDEDGNRRAERAPFENAGQDLAAIRFLALRGDRALAGTAAIEFGLNIGFAQFESRRTTVDDNANTAAMRLAPGGNAKESAEKVAHFPSMLAKAEVLDRTHDVEALVPQYPIRQTSRSGGLRPPTAGARDSAPP